MKVTTIQGIVRNGQIQLTENIQLPEMATVYVVIPEAEESEAKRIFSPRLANREDAKFFVKTVEIDDEV
jgi:NhaP-type Na+/H+ and K+/H+ antiporter